MRKALFLVILGLFLINCPVFAEDVTITTYYPAPFGVYEELRAKKIGIGTTYMDTTAVNVADDDLIVEGNIGIGTENPEAKLQIEDGAPDLTLRRTNNNNLSRILFRNSGGDYIANIHITGATNGNLVFRAGPNNSNPQALPDRLTILNNGNVGIGKLNPNLKLDVDGNIRIGKGAPGFCIGTAFNVADYNILDNAPGPWVCYVDNVDPTIDGSVGLRIGNKPNAHFTVAKAKNVYAPILASAYNPSDRRYKKDIKTIEGALDRLKNIRGVEFRLRDDDKPGMGVIAQEVEKDFPFLIMENEYGYKFVNYDGFVGVLIEAVKEQQRQIEKLQKEVESLKKE